MAEAWEYLDNDGPPPDDLRKLRLIERFGVKAVTGRDTLGYGEMSRMILLDNITTAYSDRKRYRDKNGNEDWQDWAEKNPEKAELLARVVREVNEVADPNVRIIVSATDRASAVLQDVSGETSKLGKVPARRCDKCLVLKGR